MHPISFLTLCLGIAFCSVFYCELLVDYFKLLQCSWPSIDPDVDLPTSNGETLRALILADTHLLGPVRGHWLDKLYREWHMHRAFQAAMTVFSPDVVFLLGDLFDEGDIVNHDQFQDYVQRFHRLFHTPPNTPIVSAVGNHDVGFHYKMHPFFTRRFEKSFNNTGAQLYTFKNIHFVLINSMAMDGDGCDFCKATQLELREISSKLQCLRSQSCANEEILSRHGSYSRPVLMQHFPTYRISDKVCEVHDSPVIERYREKWEVLSKDATDMLGKLLHPRLAFAGHSHHYCKYRNLLGIDEYTVASFSWRNKKHPSFLLATVSATKHGVYKCDMANEPSNYNIYLGTIIACASLLVLEIFQRCSQKMKAKKKACDKFQ